MQPQQRCSLAASNMMPWDAAKRCPRKGCKTPPRKQPIPQHGASALPRSAIPPRDLPARSTHPRQAALCLGCSLPRGGRLLPFPLSKNGVFEDGSSIVGTAAMCPEPPAALHCLTPASRLTACSSPLQRSHGGKADPVTQTLLTIAAEP